MRKSRCRVMLPAACCLTLARLKEMSGASAVVESPALLSLGAVKVNRAVETEPLATGESVRRLLRVELPVTVSVPFRAVALETIKADVEAVPVTAKLVVVAFVVVELEAVKFWRVVEPETKRSPLLLMVVVAVPPT